MASRTGNSISGNAENSGAQEEQILKEDTAATLGNNVLVLDSARSWVVCGANFVILFMSAVFGRMLSLCFLDFVQEFDVSITTTSLSFTFHLLTLSLSSILGTSLLIPVTGERVAATIGSVLSGICTMCMGMSSNIAMFILFMAFKGICVGISIVPAISMISQYFEKRRSLATALANCGISAGSMGAPPLVKLLMECFGLRGTFLIVGAMELNAVAASMLLRPKRLYSAVISSSDQTQNSATTTNENAAGVEIEAAGEEECHLMAEYDQNTPNGPKDSHTMSKTGLGQPPSVIVSDADAAIEDVPSSNSRPLSNVPCSLSQEFSSTTSRALKDDVNFVRAGRVRSVSDAEDWSRRHRRPPNSPCPTASPQNITADQLLPLTGKLRQYAIDSSALTINTDSNPMISISCEDNDSGLDIETGINFSKCQDLRKNKRSHNWVALNSSMSSRSTLSQSAIPRHLRKSSEEFHISSWSIVSSVNSVIHFDVEVCALEEQKRQDEENELADYEPEEKATETSPTISSKILAAFQNAFNVSLLRLWSVRLLMLSSITGTLTHYLPTYLPTIALKRGLTTGDVSILMTVGGTVDLASRICLGFFSDLHILTPSQIVMISQIILGTVCHFIYFYTSFDMFIFLAIAIGVFGSTRQNLITLVIIEFVGTSLFLKVFGTMAMTATLSLAIHHPLLNSILDSTGSYAPPFHFVGLALYISTVCLALGPLLKRYERKKEPEATPS